MFDASNAPTKTTDKLYALKYESQLSNVFELVKTTHILMLHFDDGLTPYDGDDIIALRSSIHLLRQKTHSFEQEFFHSKQEARAV